MDTELLTQYQDPLRYDNKNSQTELNPHLVPKHFEGPVCQNLYRCGSDGA